MNNAIACARDAAAPHGEDEKLTTLTRRLQAAESRRSSATAGRSMRQTAASAAAMRSLAGEAATTESCARLSDDEREAQAKARRAHPTSASGSAADALRLRLPCSMMSSSSWSDAADAACAEGEVGC
jgi:hypothetical protein